MKKSVLDCIAHQKRQFVPTMQRKRVQINNKKGCVSVSRVSILVFDAG